MRMIILGALILTIASAFVLYSSNYDTRQFEARVAEQERAIDKARSDISVLKAERAHLGRPGAHRAAGARPRSRPGNRAAARRNAGGRIGARRCAGNVSGSGKKAGN